MMRTPPRFKSTRTELPPQKVNCVLLLSTLQSMEMVAHLENERKASEDPYKFDKTTLGRVLSSLKGVQK
jgi:hypothetical protein